jgi:hypothetical protein
VTVSASQPPSAAKPVRGVEAPIRVSASSGASARAIGVRWVLVDQAGGVLEAELTNRLVLRWRQADGSIQEIREPWADSEIAWRFSPEHSQLHADAGDVLRVTRCTRSGQVIYASGTLLARLGLKGGRTSVPEGFDLSGE